MTSGITRAEVERPKLSEKDVERLCDSLMSQLGYEIIRFSQARATNQTPGIPDRKYFHAVRGRAVWFECKREGGKQSTAQRRFQLLAQLCDEDYVLGGIEELRAWHTNKKRGES